MESKTISERAIEEIGQQKLKASLVRAITLS